MHKKKTIPKKKVAHGKKVVSEEFAPKGLGDFEIITVEPAGLGPNVAGQSGDIEGLSTIATGNSESLAELVEEGQDLEAEKVSGVENAPDPDEGEVRTHDIRGRSAS